MTKEIEINLDDIFDKLRFTLNSEAVKVEGEPSSTVTPYIQAYRHTIKAHLQDAPWTAYMMSLKPWACPECGHYLGVDGRVSYRGVPGIFCPECAGEAVVSSAVHATFYGTGKFHRPTVKEYSGLKAG